MDLAVDQERPLFVTVTEIAKIGAHDLDGAQRLQAEARYGFRHHLHSTGPRRTDRPPRTEYPSSAPKGLAHLPRGAEVGETWVQAAF